MVTRNGLLFVVFIGLGVGSLGAAANPRVGPLCTVLFVGVNTALGQDGAARGIELPPAQVENSRVESNSRHGESDVDDDGVRKRIERAIESFRVVQDLYGREAHSLIESSGLAPLLGVEMSSVSFLTHKEDLPRIFGPFVFPSLSDSEGLKPGFVSFQGFISQNGALRVLTNQGLFDLNVLEVGEYLFAFSKPKSR